MQNCKTSAGTAAKKCSKSSLFARLPLLLAILMLCAVSCRQGSKKKISEPLSINNVEKQHFNPKIVQEVWHSEDGYHLQTYILTDSIQSHPKSYDCCYFGQPVPYNKEIKGTYFFIKNNKIKEYSEAHRFLYEYQDSVKMLDEIQVK